MRGFGCGDDDVVLDLGVSTRGPLGDVLVLSSMVAAVVVMVVSWLGCETGRCRKIACGFISALASVRRRRIRAVMRA